MPQVDSTTVTDPMKFLDFLSSLSASGTPSPDAVSSGTSAQLEQTKQTMNPVAAAIVQQLQSPAMQVASMSPQTVGGATPATAPVLAQQQLNANQQAYQANANVSLDQTAQLITSVTTSAEAEKRVNLLEMQKAKEVSLAYDAKIESELANAAKLKQELDAVQTRMGSFWGALNPMNEIRQASISAKLDNAYTAVQTLTVQRQDAINRAKNAIIASEVNLNAENAQEDVKLQVAIAAPVENAVQRNLLQNAQYTQTTISNLNNAAQAKENEARISEARRQRAYEQSVRKQEEDKQGIAILIGLNQGKLQGTAATEAWNKLPEAEKKAMLALGQLGTQPVQTAVTYAQMQAQGERAQALGANPYEATILLQSSPELRALMPPALYNRVTEVLEKYKPEMLKKYKERYKQTDPTGEGFSKLTAQQQADLLAAVHIESGRQDVGTFQVFDAMSVLGTQYQQALQILQASTNPKQKQQNQEYVAFSQMQNKIVGAVVTENKMNAGDVLGNPVKFVQQLNLALQKNGYDGKHNEAVRTKFIAAIMSNLAKAQRFMELGAAAGTADRTFGKPKVQALYVDKRGTELDLGDERNIRTLLARGWFGSQLDELRYNAKTESSAAGVLVNRLLGPVSDQGQQTQ